MAAPANNRREEIDLQPNLPVTLALRYSEPKRFDNEHGTRCMYSTVDNRVLFLPMEAAAQIAALGINVRESFTITKQWTGKPGSPITWAVARVPGEQPNGTYVVPAAGTVPPKPPAAATAAAPAAERRQESPENAFVEHAKRMVDAYAQVLEHALTTHGGRVKPEEVKSIFVTLVINGGKRAA